jgi:hypothetical protein
MLIPECERKVQMNMSDRSIIETRDLSTAYEGIQILQPLDLLPTVAPVNSTSLRCVSVINIPVWCFQREEL